MTLLCFGGMRASQGLSSVEFDRLCQHAEILEQDARGVKVLRLADGNILKIFRLRRIFSSARFYSYARRFCLNAERLYKFGVPTVRIRQLLHFHDSSNSAVLYEPLPGLTVRQVLHAGHMTPELGAKIGRFIARLHGLGVYFRSLHLGNIVLTPDGELGLIDIADMSICHRNLRWTERQRNFRHLHRYPNDIRQMGRPTWEMLLQAYFNSSELIPRATGKLEQALQRFSAFE